MVQNSPEGPGEQHAIALDASGELSRRDRILTVAIEQVSDKGFAAARMDEMAAAAGTNQSLIYYYFGDKRGLYEAALERMVEVTGPFWARIDEASDLVEVFELLSSPTVGLEWRRLLAWEGIEHSKDGEVWFAEPRRASLGRLTAAMRRAQDRGEMPARMDPEFVALLLICLTMMPVLLPQVVSLVTGLEPDGDQFAHRQAALFRDFAVVLSRAWSSAK